MILTMFVLDIMLYECVSILGYSKIYADKIDID